MIGSLPLVAMMGTANACVSLYIAGRLYLSYREHAQDAIKYFLNFYALFGVFHLFFATPQLFLLDQRFAYVVGIFDIVAYFFLNMSLGYLLAIPYEVVGRPHVARMIVRGTIIYAIFFFIFRIFYFSPSVFEQLSDYVYWRPVFPEGLRLLTGLISVAVASIISSFFIRHGMKNRQSPIVMYRSFWLAAGSGMLLIAAIVAFIVAASGVASYVLFATSLVLWGLILIMRGVMYAPESTLDI